ncbi:cupin domain-containing protein [Gordonia sp. NPDC003950]
MPLIDSPRHHDLHGATFSSYVCPSTGSRELCAWRTTLGPAQPGADHRVDHEEVFLVLAGTPRITLDGLVTHAHVGDVVFVPAGSSVRLDNPGADECQVWVSAPVGLTATTAQGQRIIPPWTL